ncbi:DNA-binding response regulator [Maribacter sp. 2307ULW6-5]|uniref:DNA-binding response regulator n=1 Tax=Maribacter sp. 2307ULW6-5 TaxID=3386275 RepID=UPI0039BD2F91
MNVVRILAVDDHEMTTTGYKYILEDHNFPNFRVRVETAKNFDLAAKKIKMSAKGIPYDIVLLDIRLDKDPDEEAKTGMELGAIVRKETPTSKVVFMSSFSDNYRINSIFKQVNPDGYMVKSEIDELSLRTMVDTVMNNDPYYTAAALTAMRRKLGTDITLDAQDEKLLFLLSKGVKTNDIAPKISMSHSTVEARKRQLKLLFGVKNGNDLALIHEAEKRGFL